MMIPLIQSDSKEGRLIGLGGSPLSSPQLLARNEQPLGGASKTDERSRGGWGSYGHPFSSPLPSYHTEKVKTL